MPNLYPDLAPWVHQASRFMSSLVAVFIGTLFILLWMRPPLRKPLLTWWQGIILAVVIAFGFLVLNKLFKNDAFQLVGAWLVIWSFVAIIAVCIMSRKPHHKGDVTWARAILGTTYAFAMFFLIYAVVPNEWILWANNGLGWTSDKILVSPEPFPFTLTYVVLNDTIAMMPYILGTIGVCLIAKYWQQRPDPVDALAVPVESDEPETPTAPSAAFGGKVRTSKFGRPLKSKV